MANIRDVKESENIRTTILFAAATLFVKNGFEATTVKEIAAEAGISISKLMYEVESKENILCDLVTYVIEGQFRAATHLVEGRTSDPLFFYAVETVLQLHIAESSEQLRNIYTSAYSLPKTSDIIQHNLTGKLEHIFGKHLPNLETKDFYELEIASGGIMRGFLTIPCDMYFTMERKARRFLETTFLVYRVPDETIQEIIEFVSQFDFPTIAEETVAQMLGFLNRSLDRVSN